MSIVPSSRLLMFTVILALPLALLAVMLPGMTWTCGILFTLFAFLAVTDAVRILRIDFDVQVEVPDVVRLSKGRPGSIPLRITNPGGCHRLVRIGLALPHPAFSADRVVTVKLPANEPFSAFDWPCVASQRGRFLLNGYDLETGSFLGLWARRFHRKACTEIRVYPDLIHERNHLAALFTNNQMGIHSQRQLGKGRDFEQLREYCSGDNFEDIHWKATAKRGFPVTKVFQVERMQEIYIIIDASRLSTRTVDSGSPTPTVERSSPPGGETILERYITAALILGMAAQREGDMFGVLPFSDRIHGFARAKTGKSHFNTCRDMLFTLTAHSVSPDFSELFTFICATIRKRALLVFLTNLDDPIVAEHFLQDVGIVSRRHLITVNMLTPAKTEPVFSSPDVHSIDDVYAALGNHFSWSSLRETERKLRKQGAGFSLMENEQMCLHLVSEYLGIKKRQIL